MPDSLNRREASCLDFRPPRPGVAADRLVEVTAPCRLHFGLLSFGRRQGRQFGGVGVMVDTPAVRLRISAADTFQTMGPLADRSRQAARSWTRFVGFDEQPACRIEVLSAAPQHVGLGVGTQLSLSVAAGLNAWHGLPKMSPGELAASVGRGRRSAVGTYGFAEGGLIVERGKLPGESIAPRDFRTTLPDSWRFVLLQPRRGQGLSGHAEQNAFEQLPPVPESVTADLTREVRQQMLPAVIQGDFVRFSESVYRYGRLAGLCFAEIQGGPYNGPYLTKLVELVRSLRVAGVGQSSWGPTLFAVLPAEDAAQTLVSKLGKLLPRDEARLSVTSPNSTGARLVLRQDAAALRQARKP
jgi:beta-RFAP synthase